jgi:hypothetical protein
MAKTKHSFRRRWIEAVALALGASAGVVQAIPDGTPWTRMVAAMLSAGLPVLVFQLRHGGRSAADPVPSIQVVGGAS